MSIWVSIFFAIWGSGESLSIFLVIRCLGIDVLKLLQTPLIGILNLLNLCRRFSDLCNIINHLDSCLVVTSLYILEFRFLLVIFASDVLRDGASEVFKLFTLSCEFSHHDTLNLSNLYSLGLDLRSACEDSRYNSLVVDSLPSEMNS
jgi:hypothetical protein